MSRHRAHRAVPAVAAALALVAAGCGGGDDQSAAEQSGSFEVDVVRTSFPAVQHLAEQAQFVAEIRNAGDRAIDNIAVTLDGFSAASDAPGLSDAARPVWVVDDGPPGGDTAYNDTWALGHLGAGETRRFVWKVSALVPGEHRLHWRVSVGLTGKAQAVTDGDRAPEGELRVRVDRAPADATVDPETGAVSRKY